MPWLEFCSLKVGGARGERSKAPGGGENNYQHSHFRVKYEPYALQKLGIQSKFIIAVYIYPILTLIITVFLNIAHQCDMNLSIYVFSKFHFFS